MPTKKKSKQESKLEKERVAEMIQKLQGRRMKWKTDVLGRIRTKHTNLCPLQVLTGKEVGYYDTAMDVLGLPAQGIVEAADKWPGHPRGIRRQLMKLVEK